jgi:hypothetical protein
MGNFSKTPSDVLQASQKKNYVGVYIEQGVPVLDRDMNLLQDLISTTVRSVISRFIGDGVASGSNGFAIQAIVDPLASFNNFRILGGSALVTGIDVINSADLNYADQPGVPPLTTPPASPITRTDSVYLDISLTEVSGAQDPELLNSGDVGLQTSVRQRVVWVVRVAEGATSPPPPAAGHTNFPLARLVRTAGNQQIQAGMITDLRKQISSLAEGLRILGAPAFGAPAFSPASGGAGGTTNLTGRNFNVAPLTVTFISAATSIQVQATAVVVNSATSATVTVPSGINGACRIAIANQFGSDTSTNTFNVL